MGSPARVRVVLVFQSRAFKSIARRRHSARPRAQCLFDRRLARRETRRRPFGDALHDRCRCGVRRTGVERRCRRVFELQLDRLRFFLAGQLRGDRQGEVDAVTPPPVIRLPSRTTRSRTGTAPSGSSSEWNAQCVVARRRAAGRPRPAATHRAHRRHVARGGRALLHERDRFGIEQQRVDPDPARNADHVERRTVVERRSARARVRCSMQRSRATSDQMNGGVGSTRARRGPVRSSCWTPGNRESRYAGSCGDSDWMGRAVAGTGWTGRF